MSPTETPVTLDPPDLNPDPGPGLTPLTPWDRTPNESPEAWEAFTTYRDMGYGRSLAKVSQQLGKHVTQIERWSRGLGWVARVEAWDDELDRQRRAEHIEAVRTMAGEHAKAGNALIEKALAALPHIDEAKMSPTQVARFMQVGVSVVRQALGQPSIAVSGDSGEADEALVEAMVRYFEERQTAAFMEGAAAGAEVGADTPASVDA